MAHDLPDTTAVRLPRRLLLHGLRPLSRFVFRRWVPVQVHGVEGVPTSGPVIFASNHVGVIDGPFLAGFSPRAVHALTKNEMFKGFVGACLRGTGQIPLNRFSADPSAMKTCLAALRDGRAIGIFPEGTRGAGDFGRFHGGAAYLALVSGAPVVPVSMIGTRAPGASSSALPPRDGRVDIFYGQPFQVEQTPWPRTREQVRHSSLLLREHMIAQLDDALALTGRQLPGPLPVGQQNIDDDPPTGVVEQGA